MNLAVLLWGFTGVLGRAISLNAAMLVWYRMLLTALFMAAILTYRKQWVKIERPDLFRLASIGLLMGIHWIAFYGSIKLANASIALVCLSTSPIFTTIFDKVINKTPFNFKELLLSIVGITGMYMIYRFQQLYAWGIAAGIAAAILAAWFTVLNKKIAHKYPARTMVFYEMSTGWLLITLILPFQFYYLPQTALAPTANDWIWLVVLSLCCTVWAQSLALSALKHISSFTATLSVNLEPVYGIILAFIFFNENEQLHAGFYVGMALILSGVLLQMVRLLKTKRTPSPGFIEEKSGID